MKSGRATIMMALALVGVAGPVTERPVRQSGDPAAFLQRLTGDWSVIAEAVLGPGQEPVRTDSRAVARSIGGKWLLVESTGTAAGGQTFTSIRTIGYDPADERFVGTWISSLQTHLWSHAGQLDDTGTSLTLETEGPVLGDATRTARYREIIEIEGADRYVVRSLILGPDGEWFEFARAEYLRADGPIDRDDDPRPEGTTP